MHTDRLEAEWRDRLESLRARVQKHCYRMLQNLDRAEDATQETMLNAWNRRDSYREESPLEHWVMRIATNACLDLLRHQHNRQTIAFDEGKASQLSAKDPAMNQVEDQILLQQLLPPLRACMGEQNFWIWQQKLVGMTEEQIAQGLPAHWRLTKDGVHSRVQRQIRTCLDKMRRQHARGEAPV